MRPMKLAAAAVMLAACGAATGVAGAEPPPAPAPAPAPKQVIDTDGTFTVGKDIAPGTYRSDGPREGNACYWRRNSGDKIVDSAMTKKPQVVLIEPSDTTFRTDRCAPWQLTECPPTCAPVPQQSAGLPDVLKGFVPQQRPAAPSPAPSGG
ncbi:MAG: hypothetical protein WBH51_00265 [Mycolicibacter algericus]|uniref:hypothetical protein n=1 Tax=Mycolicibacter algericus TaxID=1288388 RepID=UPI003C71110E